MLKDLKAFIAAARRFPAERLALFRKVIEIRDGVANISAQHVQMVHRFETLEQHIKILDKALDERVAALKQDSAGMENGLQSSIGRMAQEVNAILNFSHLQQAVGSSQDSALSELKAGILKHQQQLATVVGNTKKIRDDLVAQEEAIRATNETLVARMEHSLDGHSSRLSEHAVNRFEQGTAVRLDDFWQKLSEQHTRQTEQLGRIANEVNAALNAVVGQQGDHAALTNLVSSALSGTGTQQAVLKGLATDINATLTTVSRQQETLMPVVHDVRNTLSAISGQQTLLGPMANELNAALNSVMAQQSAQSAIVASLARIENDSIRADARTQALNLLVGRGTAALVRRQFEKVEHRTPVLLPAKPPTIAKQIETLGRLAPLNIESWTAAYKAGIAEGERSVEGNLSHDGHLGAGFFRFFINVHARGRLLDFGCGPLPVPAYLADWPIDQLAGFDPQKPFAPHPFPFAQTLGETVPWPDHSFETVVIATSLDHVYLLDRALAEVRRVLVPDGRLLLWTAVLPSTAPYDPYAERIIPPDMYHLFHPGQNWFYKLFEEDYDLLERMETFGQAEMLAYQLKPRPIIR